MSSKSFLRGEALLLATGLSFSTVPIFITWLTSLGVSPWFQLGGRLLIASVILALFVLPFVWKQMRFSGTPGFTTLGIQGLLLLGALSTYTLSIALGTPPAKAILLSNLSPLFATLLGRAVLGESLSRRKIGAIALGLAGIAFTLRAWDAEGLTHLEASDILALANGLIYASFLVFSRWKGKREGAHPMASTLWLFFFAVGWLALASLAMLLWSGPTFLISQLPATLDWRIVAGILGLATAGTVIPFTFINWALRRTEAGTASILLLSEPVCVFLLSYLVLGHPIGWWQLVGGALILSAGLLVAA